MTHARRFTTDHASTHDTSVGVQPTLFHDASTPTYPQVTTHSTHNHQSVPNDASTDSTRFSQVSHTRARAHAPGRTPALNNASSVDTPWWAHAYETRTGGELRLAGDRLIPARHDCGRWILHGYDAPVLAVHVHLDPNPLTPALEAACVILAIPTYQLWGNPGRWSCTTRHQPGLTRLGRVPPAGDVVVLAAHSCTRPPLTSEQLRMTATTRPRPTDPPY